LSAAAEKGDQGSSEDEWDGVLPEEKSIICPVEGLKEKDEKIMKKEPIHSEAQ